MFHSRESRPVTSDAPRAAAQSVTRPTDVTSDIVCDAFMPGRPARDVDMKVREGGRHGLDCTRCRGGASGRARYQKLHSLAYSTPNADGRSLETSAGKSRAQAREDRERAQARAREPLTGEPYEL